MKKQDRFAFARDMVPVKRRSTRGRCLVAENPRGHYAAWLKDGLYRVQSHPRNGGKPFTAGFVIRSGRVVQCAPIIRGNIRRWLNWAEFVCEV